jgi:lactoylglutathione lyase
MKIDHVALWVENLEIMKDFYLHYFSGNAGQRYENPAKGFSSYFVSFDGGARIELMCRNDMEGKRSENTFGWAHLAISVGSVADVDYLTARLQLDGCVVESLPRTTGDGYYESVIRDPEGNRVELVGSRQG